MKYSFCNKIFHLLVSPLLVGLAKMSTLQQIESFALLTYARMLKDGLCIIPTTRGVDMVEISDLEGAIPISFSNILKNEDAMNLLFSYSVSSYMNEKLDMADSTRYFSS